MSTTTTPTMTETETSTTSITKPNYPKKLEGVQVTEDLLKLWQSQCRQAENHTTTTTTTISTTSEIQKAYETLQSSSSNAFGEENPPWVPMDVVRALGVLVSPDDLDRALEGSSLVFTPPPKLTKDDLVKSKKFEQRMARLRLKYEETKYVKLTNNLQSHYEEDDITAKSMTYAASVGLNMIIAPISFGCFMYFFAGGLLDWFFPAAVEDDSEIFSSTTGRYGRKPPTTDIKRVIIGVVSGVVMLFIEMILFVIRTHEFEAHTRKKQQKRSVQPFGAYSQNDKREYVSKEGPAIKKPATEPQAAAKQPLAKKQD